MSETIKVKFKRGIRTDGQLEEVSITQEGFGELRLTLEQAWSLVDVLQNKLPMRELQRALDRRLESIQEGRQ